MKKLLLIAYCFIASYSVCYSQNLVSNGSFDQLSSCPSTYGQIDSAIGWWGVATPDLFNSCSVLPNFLVPVNVDGTQLAYNGNGYAVFASYLEPPSVDAREYVQTKLLDSLVYNSKYYLSFVISFGDILQYASDGVGAFVSMLAK